jgi:hypothetical protein
MSYRAATVRGMDGHTAPAGVVVASWRRRRPGEASYDSLRLVKVGALFEVHGTGREPSRGMTEVQALALMERLAGRCPSCGDHVGAWMTTPPRQRRAVNQR